jgi:hypothetical protein
MEKANKSGENANNPFTELDKFFATLFQSMPTGEEVEEEISENAMIVAKELFNQFSAFIAVGFSRPEAFRLIQTIIANSIKGGNING